MDLSIAGIPKIQVPGLILLIAATAVIEQHNVVE